MASLYTSIAMDYSLLSREFVTIQVRVGTLPEESHSAEEDIVEKLKRAQEILSRIPPEEIVEAVKSRRREG